MNPIRLLDSETIDKIAAGEVVERPANVVKELTENSIDGNATIINVEIKNGGIDLIRVTDNGSGIENNQPKTAFLKHPTSKLTTITDLDSLVSLGFRGEALSSISAVSMTEMITKTEDALLGTHISIEGGKITEFAEVGAPKGTTVIVRQLFYNTPARRKFLKSPQSEAARVEEVVERIAISHPEISFSFTVNGKTKFTTSGNGSVKDVIYRVYGREIYERLLDIDHTWGDNHIYGYVARPEYNLGTRELEIFLVNKRLVSSKELSVSVENGYHGFLMQHRFPFCVVFIDTDPATLDVNVHPQKAEIRFSEMADVSKEIAETVADALHEPELIPVVKIDEPKPQVTYTVPETTADSLPEGVEDTEFESPSETPFPREPEIPSPPKKEVIPQAFETRRYHEVIEKVMEDSPKEEELTYKQQDLFEERLIDDKPLKEYTIIGQVFKTYWLISLNDNLYIVDQHAAHEKVNYETFLKAYLSDESIATQMISPPVVVNLTPGQAVILNENLELFNKIGYEIEDFGDKSYAIRGVPMNLYGFEQRELFMSLIEEISVKDKVYTPELILAKLASMSCKASIKGNNTVSYEEMKVLMDKLMSLDNPYNCPHGRPTFICITKTELDKKFKRIV